METANIVLLLLNAFLLIILSKAYYAHSKRVEHYEVQSDTFRAAFMDIAALVQLLKEQEDSNQELFKLNEEELTVVRTILSIHSEILNVNTLQKIFADIDKIKQERST